MQATRIVIEVEGMTCERNCARRVREGLEQALSSDFVLVHTDFATKQFSIFLRTNNHTNLDIILNAVPSPFSAHLIQNQNQQQAVIVGVKVEGMMCERSCATKVRNALLSNVKGCVGVGGGFKQGGFGVAVNLNGMELVGDAEKEILDAVSGAGFVGTIVHDFNFLKLTPTPTTTTTPPPTPTTTTPTTTAPQPKLGTSFPIDYPDTSPAEDTDVFPSRTKGKKSLRVPLLSAPDQKNHTHHHHTIEMRNLKQTRKSSHMLMLSVMGMTCASCTGNIEALLRKQDGVLDVSVSLVSHTARVVVDPMKISSAAVIAHIASLGFEAFPAETAVETEDGKAVEMLKLDQQAIWNDLRIALVFTIPVFLISMILSQIEACDRALTDHSFINITVRDFLLLIFTTPVQLWIGKRFHRRAWFAIRNRRTNMDVLVSVGTSVAYLYSVLLLFFQAVTVIRATKEHRTFFETSALLITFILIGKYIESFVKGKTNEALSQLIKLQPPMASVITVDPQNPKTILNEKQTSVSQVHVDDHVIVRGGESVPVDGVVIHGEGYVNESMITGESMPSLKRNGADVIGGTILASGMIYVRVTKTGGDTALSQIIRLVEEAQMTKAPIQALVDRVSAVFVPSVVCLSLLTFFIWLIVGAAGGVPHSVYQDEHSTVFLLAFTFGVSVMVISCPCTLGLATPTAVVAGTGKGAALGILIKGADILQRTGSINTVVFDKTGTLTKGTLCVSEVLMSSQSTVDEKTALKLVASAEVGSGHPIARAIVARGNELNSSLLPVDNFEEIEGQGIRCSVESHLLVVGNREMLRDFPPSQEIDKRAAELELQGHTVVFVGIDNQFSCAIGVCDTIKPEAAEVIAALHAKGISTLMITGDNLRTARALANMIGVDRVLAETKPKDKAHAIQELQKDTTSLVAMVGDGVNDSPALAAADIGIAIGSGTSVAIEVADVVLLKNNLWDVVVALDLSRTILRRIQLNLLFSFLYNLLAVPFAAGVFFPWLHVMPKPHWAGAAMAASSVCVVTSSFLLRFYQPPMSKKVASTPRASTRTRVNL